MLSNGRQLIYRFGLYADKMRQRDQLLASVRSLEADLEGWKTSFKHDQLQRAHAYALEDLNKIMAAMDADRVILEALKGDYLRSGRTHDELEVLLCGIHGPESGA